MRRFTKPEDLEGLEDIHSIHAASQGPSIESQRYHHHFVPENQYQHGASTTNTSSQSTSTSTRSEDSEQSRQYLNTHTSFLNSADTEGSGYIPDHHQGHSHVYHHHYPTNSPSLTCSQPSLSSSAARTPIHYPSSLMDEDGPTAPGTPLSFVSSPSIGYYSHPSRPSSRTGLWVDQATSSLNLIMPSSAMFVKTREPTVEGDKMGFLKMMVAGRSRTWNLRLIRELFKWEGIIANDFDDEFLKSPVMEEGGSSDTGSNMDAHGLSSGVESRSSQSSDPSIEWTRRRRHKQQQQHAAADALVERYASTTVLPMWARAGLDEQDMHQEILVKNICFVDTPGYNSFTNTQRAMDLVISYLGVQFQATNEFFSRSIVSDDSLGRFLANNTTGAHSHVDLCLYVIEDQLTALDIQFLARLQPFVNILPVLIPNLSSSHDAQSPDVTAVRQDIIRQLREHEIYAYGMGQSKEQQDSLFSTRLAMEDELSPPPLVLDAQVPSPYVFTTPPFVLKLSGNDVEERRTDAAVQHLDIHRSDNAQLRHPTEGSTQSSTSIDTRGQLDALRHWIYTENLPALRHQTTLKFLSWRRRLPFMASLSIDSSQESGSLQPRHQNPQLMYPDLGDYASGSFQAFSTSINKSSPPPSVADQPHPLQQHPHQHQRAMPTHGLAQLHTQDRQRLSAKAAQMLEPYSQVFERILRERHEAWQLALQGLEREQRIEFLVQEIRRWATEGALPHTDQQQPLAPGHQELDVSYRHVVGLGLGSGHGSVRPPSLKDALDPDLASTRANTHLSTQRRTGKRRTKKSPIPKATENSDLPEETKSEYDHGEDPLGLGQLMGRLLGALGRGLVQVVMMIGMGSFATWIYTHFLEHRVMWI